MPTPNLSSLVIEAAHDQLPAANNPPAQAASWRQALTLPERAASLASVGVDMGFDTARAERRLRRWRDQPPFADDAIFAQRLALDELDEQRLGRLLGESPEALRERSGDAPDWLVTLLRAFAGSEASDALPVPEELRQRPTAGFLNLVAPLLEQGCERLRAGILALRQARTDLPFDPDTIEALLFAGLPGQLIHMVSRTLVLELHVARLQGRLPGATPEERFQRFGELLRQRETALAILEEYPVLARALVRRVDTSVAVSLELLQRLCDDWQAIRATFAPGDDPGVLTALDGGSGDQHRGGRSVVVAGFSSGFRLVYKPKSMAVDRHFQELLRWLNARGDHPPFRTLKIVDRGTHGWVEHVAAQSCASPAEIRSFYQRQGGYLALLYALESTDFHCENLIAAGEHPVMIDLEALFHPHLGADPLAEPGLVAEQTMLYSVLRVGLLPQRILGGKQSEGVDISGLGAAAGQLTPYAVPRWEGAGTDQMQLTRKRVRMEAGQNRPALHGRDVDLLDYAEEITGGFTDMYRLLQSHRAELLAEDGPLARFAGDEVRVILRPTATYATLLSESLHPDVLRDALDRDRLFDRLWAGAGKTAAAVKIIAAERADLYNGDIPMFTTTPGSRDLWNGAYGRIAAMFEESGLMSVRRRLRQLSDTDLERQRWFIRASLATLATGEDAPRRPSGAAAEGPAPAGRAELLRAARAVGDHLELLALRGEQEAAWIGLTYGPDGRWSLAPLATDLYSGLPGVVLFLAYLGSLAGEQRYTVLARAALTTLRKQLASEPAPVASIGAFEGLGGIIYTLAHLGILWDAPGLYAEAEALVERIPGLLAHDGEYDVIGGAAGCIGGLLSLYHAAGSERALAVALQCGDWILEHAQPLARGIGWVALGGTEPLAGFSHGAAGMAWALLELEAAGGAARFRRAALDALAYERTLYAPEAENWLDLRGFAADKGRCMTAWCHGAPGIGLGRLQVLRHLDDAEIRTEIQAALRTTCAEGFGHNHSLCHGDLGNIELLLQASLAFDDAELHARTYRIAAGILGQVEAGGWRCGVPLGAEMPGLMTGLAGIGYALLRLAEPQGVPSVLVLAPPVAPRLSGA